MAVTTAEKPRSRSKLTKALVATGVGVALLAGGGGTFAVWTSTSTVDTNKTVVAGSLKLTKVTGGVWTDMAGNTITDAYRIAPGAQIKYTATADIELVGEGLVADFKVTAPAIAGLPADPSALSTTISVTGKDVAVESANSVVTARLNQGGAYTVTMVVALDGSADNSWQNAVLGIKHTQLDVTQVLPSSQG